MSYGHYEVDRRDAAPGGIDFEDPIQLVGPLHPASERVAGVVPEMSHLLGLFEPALVITERLFHAGVLGHASRAIEFGGDALADDPEDLLILFGKLARLVVNQAGDGDHVPLIIHG